MIEVNKKRTCQTKKLSGSQNIYENAQFQKNNLQTYPEITFINTKASKKSQKVFQSKIESFYPQMKKKGKKGNSTKINNPDNQFGKYVLSKPQQKALQKQYKKLLQQLIKNENLFIRQINSLYKSVFMKANHDDINQLYEQVVKKYEQEKQNSRKQNRKNKEEIRQQLRIDKTLLNLETKQKDKKDKISQCYFQQQKKVILERQRPQEDQQRNTQFIKQEQPFIDFKQFQYGYYQKQQQLSTSTRTLSIGRNQKSHKQKQNDNLLVQNPLQIQTQTRTVTVTFIFNRFLNQNYSQNRKIQNNKQQQQDVIQTKKSDDRKNIQQIQLRKQIQQNQLKSVDKQKCQYKLQEYLQKNKDSEYSLQQNHQFYKKQVKQQRILQLTLFQGQCEEKQQIIPKKDKSQLQIQKQHKQMSFIKQNSDNQIKNKNNKKQTKSLKVPQKLTKIKGKQPKNSKSSKLIKNKTQNNCSLLSMFTSSNNISQPKSSTANNLSCTKQLSKAQRSRQCIKRIQSFIVQIKNIKQVFQQKSRQKMQLKNGAFHKMRQNSDKNMNKKDFGQQQSENGQQQQEFYVYSYSDQNDNTKDILDIILLREPYIRLHQQNRINYEQQDKLIQGSIQQQQQQVQKLQIQNYEVQKLQIEEDNNQPYDYKIQIQQQSTRQIQPIFEIPQEYFKDYNKQLFTLACNSKSNLNQNRNNIFNYSTSQSRKPSKYNKRNKHNRKANNIINQNKAQNSFYQTINKNTQDSQLSHKQFFQRIHDLQKQKMAYNHKILQQLI